MAAVPWWGWFLAVVAGTAVLGRAMYHKWKPHEWRECSCFDCRQKRYTAHTRQGHKAVGVAPDGDIVWAPAPRPTSTRWLSAAQLEPRMVVVVNRVPYRVEEIHTDMKGYVIRMQNMNTRRPVIVTVNWANGNTPYWEPR